jgi:hypothetical protein
MLLQAVLALALPFWSHHPAQPQAMTGREFEALTSEVGRRCPASEPQVRAARPDRLLAVQDAFRAQLSGPARARLDERLPRTRDGRIARCQGQEGAACPAEAYLTAFREARVDGAFVLYLCGHARRLR